MYTPAEPKRRKFFKIATAGTVASAAGGLPMMFKPNAALAEELLGSAAFATIVKVARDIFPHDRFEDQLYANAVGVYADQIKSNEELRKTLMDGVDKVNIEAHSRYGKTYVNVAAESDRAKILSDMAKPKTHSSASCVAIWWLACTTSQRSGPSSGTKAPRHSTVVTSTAALLIKPGWTISDPYPHNNEYQAYRRQPWVSNSASTMRS